jgi:predicted Zn-dependent protease
VIAAGLFAAAVAGALVWRWEFADIVRGRQRFAHPVASKTIVVRESAGLATAPAPEARVLEPEVLAMAAAQIDRARRTLTSASLLSADGSEMTAPTCDELLVSAVPKGNHTWSDHVRVARAALVRGDLDGSQRAFCNAIGAGNAPAMVSVELARLLLLRRDAVAASRWVHEALRTAPESPRVLDLLGDAAVRLGDLDGARRAWLGAAGLSSDDRAGIERMVRRILTAADTSLRERDPRRAERFLRRVVAFRPDDAEAHAKLAIALAKLGFPDSAELWSRRGAELGG